MALTASDIITGFNSSGIDTPAKLAAALAGMTVQLQIKRLDIKIAALQADRVAVLTPIANQEIQLANDRAALTALL